MALKLLFSIPLQIIICVIFLQIRSGSSIDFSSLFSLPVRVFVQQENIIKVHQIVREGLQNLLVEEDQKDNEILKSKLIFEELGKKSVEETFNNPISAYKYYNSAESDLFYLLDYIGKRNLSHEFIEHVEKLKELPEYYPNGIVNTVGSIALAIAKIQSLYNLDIIEDIAKKGELMGLKTNETFLAWDLMNIGRICQTSISLDYVLDWITKAQLMCEEENSCDKPSRFDKNTLRTFNLEVLVTYFVNLRQRDLVFKYIDEIIELNPFHEHASSTKTILESNFPTQEPAISKNTMDKKFRQLCLGKSEFTKIPILNCSYSDFGLSYYKIGPQKIEMLRKYPKLVIFHDLMSDNEISILKKYSRRKLETQKKPKDEIENKESDENKKEEEDEKEESLDEKSLTSKKILERLSRLIGFGLDAKNPLEILEYPSYDGIFNKRVYFENEDDINLNSGLFVFFFNDIDDFHGATIFEELGITIQPRKGSVVFLFNPPKIGTNINHRAEDCPLIHSSKFVAFKWIN